MSCCNKIIELTKEQKESLWMDLSCVKSYHRMPDFSVMCRSLEEERRNTKPKEIYYKHTVILTLK